MKITESESYKYVKVTFPLVGFSCLVAGIAARALTHYKPEIFTRLSLYSKWSAFNDRRIVLFLNSCGDRLIGVGAFLFSTILLPRHSPKKPPSSPDRVTSSEVDQVQPEKKPLPQEPSQKSSDTSSPDRVTSSEVDQTQVQPEEKPLPQEPSQKSSDVEERLERMLEESFNECEEEELLEDAVNVFFETRFIENPKISLASPPVSPIKGGDPDSPMTASTPKKRRSVPYSRLAERVTHQITKVEDHSWMEDGDEGYPGN